VLRERNTFTRSPNRPTEQDPKSPSDPHPDSLIRLGESLLFGPGKIDVLRAVAERGSKSFCRTDSGRATQDKPSFGLTGRFRVGVSGPD
jgi:hypothetical protein